MYCYFLIIFYFLNYQVLFKRLFFYYKCFLYLFFIRATYCALLYFLCGLYVAMFSMFLSYLR